MIRWIALLCLLFSFGSNVAQKIDHIEPPFWWSGMQQDSLQILLHGNNVGLSAVKINHEYITFLNLETTDNPNYLFINLIVKAHEQAFSFDIELTHQKKTSKIPYDIYVRSKHKNAIQGFNPSDVIYLITPDRFANGDTQNDNISSCLEGVNRKDKDGRHGGDIKGISQHLDYIKDLGFTAVWLNPLLENNMEKYSYHGYSTTDYYRVDPRFGTNEDYRALVNQCHDKDLKMIMDMIINHCGSNHWWMTDLPSDDWINQWPQYTQTNHRKTLLQDPYASKIDYKEFTDGWFVPTMPDLNQRNPLLGKYLIQNSIFWVEYLGLDGIRMDTYPYPDMEYMNTWLKALKLEYPMLSIVGEEWFQEPTIISYWQKGKTNPNGYQSELESLMDFPLQMALIKALTEEEAWFDGWIKLYETIAQDYLYPDPSALVIFPDNHDMSRLFTELKGDLGLYKLAMTFFLTMRGVPQIYYGTEILMHNDGDNSHGNIRSDFPGGWANDSIQAISGEGLTKQQKEAQAFVKQLLQWRKGCQTIHDGALKHFIPREGVYVYFRYTDDETLMVILNKNDEEFLLDFKRYNEMIGDEKTGINVLTNEQISLDAPLLLQKKSPYLISIK